MFSLHSLQLLFILSLTVVEIVAVGHQWVDDGDLDLHGAVDVQQIATPKKPYAESQFAESLRSYDALNSVGRDLFERQYSKWRVL